MPVSTYEQMRKDVQLMVSICNIPKEKASLLYGTHGCDLAEAIEAGLKAAPAVGGSVPAGGGPPPVQAAEDERPSGAVGGSVPSMEHVNTYGATDEAEDAIQLVNAVGVSAGGGGAPVASADGSASAATKWDGAIAAIEDACAKANAKARAAQVAADAAMARRMSRH